MTSRRKLALATLTLEGVAPAELIEAAAATGFGAVTLRVAAAFPGERPPLAARSALAEASRLLRDRGLGVLDVELIKLSPEADDDDFEAVLDRAESLGAEHVITVNDDPDERTATRRFARVCELAAPRGIRPALEFMLWRPTQTVAQAHRIVSEAEHPAGAVLVDALHLRRSGGDPAEIAALAERSPDRFPYLQLCDAASDPPAGGDAGLRREALGGRLLPGDGDLPLRDLVSAFPPETSISVETPNEALRELPPSEVARRAAAATDRLLAALG